MNERIDPSTPAARLTIREATAADLERLVDLIGAYWRHDGIAGFDPARLAAQVREFLADPALGRAWLGTVDGRAEAYLLCTFVYSFEHGGRMAEIDELYVAERCRGHGVGTRLVEHAIATTARAGCVALQMQVADGNDGAQAFYASLGFTVKAGYRLWVRERRPSDGA
jgi:ribosomal protein S18 acetylase RimI-like enzyme